VPRRNEGEVEIVVKERAASVTGIDLLRPEGRHVHRELEYGE
jgi:hypothetical protein